jgi:hypothetical protein
MGRQTPLKKGNEISGIALFALDGHKKRQRKMTNVFIVKEKKPSGTTLRLEWFYKYIWEHTLAPHK